MAYVCAATIVGGLNGGPRWDISAEIEILAF